MIFMMNMEGQRGQISSDVVTNGLSDSSFFLQFWLVLVQRPCCRLSK